MDIQYLGLSSFIIKGKDANLVTDPFDPKYVGMKYPSVKADVVTVSHDHKDHNRDDLVKEVKRPVKGPGEYEISGISIIGIPTFHDDEKGKKRGKNTVYVIEMDGIRLCHLGDLGHKLSEDALDTIGDIDVLMVPVGGEYTIDYKIAAEVTRTIEPNLIIPMHFKLPSLDKDTFGKLTDLDPFLKEMSLPVNETGKLKIKSSESLGEEQKICVMELTK